MNIPIKIGKASEMRVVAELIDRGYHPYLPVVDDHGVDIMLSSGVRIQVKSATLRQGKQMKFPAYHFTLGILQQGALNNRKYGRRKKNYSDECDYIIFYGITENRFWIVPSFLLDRRRCLAISDKSPIVRGSSVKELRAKGLFYEDIAKELGVSIGTAWKRVNQCDAEKGGFIRAVKLCEDQWQFIASKAVVSEHVEEFESYRKEIEAGFSA